VCSERTTRSCHRGSASMRGLIVRAPRDFVCAAALTRRTARTKVAVRADAALARTQQLRPGRAKTGDLLSDSPDSGGRAGAVQRAREVAILLRLRVTA